jgi:ABC-type bacteriocin/lantibiotic exporter with double-glycine peptidase domain
MTDQRTMTNQQVLAVCRSNWQYRGIDDKSVREMLDELSAHLEDAVAAGRTPQDVVGDDVKKFAASWARARAPFPRRLLRTAAMVCFVIGCLTLATCLVRWTTERVVSVDDVAFWAVLAAVTVAWELRRGSLGLGRNLAVALVAGLVAVLLSQWLGGDGALFTLPLWVAVALLLPGLPYAVADARGRKSAASGID